MTREELQGALDQLLEPVRFRDYCPNGLQVEGRAQISSLLSGVTASLALIEAAVAADADAILVHHGLFWKGDDMRVVGPKKRRLELLLKHGINLFAYHLPLDAHGELGNNAQLAKQLGFTLTGRFAEQEIGFLGDLPAPMTAQAVATLVGERLGRTPLLVGDGAHMVRKVAWCTGGAQGYFEQAIAAGCELYLSGEISEQTTHLARESGVPYIAAGHHATERYGVQAIGAWLAQSHGIAHRFVEIANPA
ncbi:MAG TPA: Nif3-like dinuclear metal center hexameric protein [Burkholderiales bacterium]|nr:Nif3-like dinuclear metal center hexameric protein [Burkholderiales bacterium]